MSAIAETIARFLLGGLIVSLFALLGSALRPPSFSGIFGSAPSVAIATLSLVFATEGAQRAATEARSMIIGAVGLIAYCGVCRWTLRRPQLPVWLAAGSCWVVWLVVTLLLWKLCAALMIA